MTPPTRDRRPSVRADDGDRLDARCVQRQRFALVLEQRDALTRALKRHGAVGNRVQRIRTHILRMRAGADPLVPQSYAQQAQDLIVDRGFRNFAGADRRQQRFLVHEFGIRHLEVESAVGRAHAIVGCIPVRHEQPLKSPLSLENFQIQEWVLRGVDAVDQIVGIHDRGHLALFDDRFKGREVDLPQRALIHIGADVVPVVLLVVRGKVLEGRAHALGLHSRDVRDGQSGIEIRVFGKIFEVAAADRRPRNVDAKREQKVDAAGARVASQPLAYGAGHCRVPGGRQSCSAGIRRRRTPGANPQRSIGHLEARQPHRWDRLGVHRVGAAHQLNLLLEGEPGQNGMGLRFNLRRVDHRSRGRGFWRGRLRQYG